MWEGEERTGVGSRRENGCGKEKRERVWEGEERTGVGSRRENGCGKEKRERVWEGEKDLSRISGWFPT